MQKKLNMKDSRNFINIQNSDNIRWNVDDNFVLHQWLVLDVMDWWWGNEWLVRLAWVDELAIKLITQVKTVWLTVASKAFKEWNWQLTHMFVEILMVKKGLKKIPIINVDTKTISTGKLILCAVGQGKYRCTLIPKTMEVIVYCPFVRS